MNEKRIRFILLFGLTLFLCAGSVFLNPNINLSNLDDEQGDVPFDIDSPDSSALTELTGTGSNVGIYQYANGMKSGTITDSISNWQIDSGTPSYMRTSSNVPMPVPDGYKLKGLSATVNGLRDYHQFIADKTLNSGDWTIEAGSFDIAGNERPQLVENGRKGTGSTEYQNSYFQSQNGISFDIGTHQKTYSGTSTTGWNSAEQWATNTVPSRTQSSSHYYTSTKSDETGRRDEEFCNPADSNFGYRDEYNAPTIDAWDDALFSNNGGTQPTDMTSVEKHTPNFPSLPTSGVHQAWAELWSYGSSGYRTPTIDLTTYSRTAVVSVAWSDSYNMYYQMDKEIPWTDDGTLPQYASVSYTLTRLNFTSENSINWYNTPGNKKGSGTRTENKKVEVEVILVDPTGGTSSLGTYKFGEGPLYASDSSYIKDNAGHPYTIVITDKLTASYAVNPWKLRFKYTISITNTGTFSDISSTAASGIGSYAWMCVECNAKSKFGVQLSAVSSTVQDERTWDNGAPENYVYVKSSSIDFGNRTVYRGSDPYFEFDWIVPRGISGPVSATPLSGLAYAQPIVLIQTHKMVNNAGTWSDQVENIYINDGETFETVRNRAKPSTFPWLGTGRVWGVDHFNATSSGLGTKLNGVNSIVIYIGFKFTNQFITDWNVQSLAKGGNGNNSIMITNASFAFLTNPLPSELSMQLVWDRVEAAQESFNFIDSSIGAGTLTSTASVLQEYTDHTTGRQFYFRVLASSLRCYFEWTLTLNLTSITWGTTTTYKISNSGSVRFEANFTLNVPTKTGYTTDYKDTWWFDIIFPKYQMQTGGESYWDLIFAYEQSHLGQFKLGEENLGEALDDKANKIAVYEDDTDNYRYRDGTPLTGELHATDEFPYHQFGRFHHDAFAGWVGSGITTLRWNVLFQCPNYVSSIQLSKNANFLSTDSLFYSNEYCYVKGTYAVTMNPVVPAFDVGSAMIRWLTPTNTQINSLIIPSNRISGQSYNTSVVANKHFMTTETPDNDYSAQFIYNDSNVCGDGRVGGEYCSGLFRLGYKYATFSSQHGSYVNQQQGVYVESTSIAIDGVPTIDTLLMHRPFEIIITWLDSVTSTPITGADVKILVDKWERESTMVKRSIPVTQFNNVSMTQMGNGSYRIFVNPEYKGNLMPPYGPANMTQGFHNFTVYLNKDGYDSKKIQSNFSIIVDTIMIITSPRHTLYELNGYSTPQRPHFDEENAFAGREYTFVVKFYENLTDLYDQNNLFVDDEGTFYYTMYNVTYQLVGWLDKNDKTPPINSWLDGQVVNLTYAEEVQSSFINGSLEASSGGSEHVGAFTWPKFGDLNQGGGVYGAPRYEEGVHLYYNISFKIETNRTKYTRDYFWQPNDVRVQTCEDNPADGGTTPDAEKYFREEVFGINLHAENTGNATFVSLVNDPAEDGQAFNMGTYKPDVEHYGLLTEKYEINNYWYNASAPRFRLRAILNCTNGAGEGKDTSKAPPVGPLNATNEMYGNILDWFGDTEMVLTGWNGTEINMTADTDYLWSCYVNGSWSTPVLAYGVTYVSPWIYYNKTDAGTKYITIRSSKKGFIDDTLIVQITTWSQNTTVYNNTAPHNIFSKASNQKAKVTTPTGIETSFILQFNDSTPGNPMFGIENATLACVDDDWVGHFSSNEGKSWYWEELGKGRYKITLNDTFLNVLSPTIKSAEFELTKENYTMAAFVLDITIIPRDMKIIYLGGQDLGYYLPIYVDSNWTQLHHIRLTYAILDLSNESASIDFSNTIIQNYFSFKQPDLTPYTTSTVKFWNGTGFNYNVTIKTNIGMEFSVYTKPLVVNFSIFGVTNYYPTYETKGITIEAIDTAVQLRSPASGIQTSKYLWNSSGEWLTGCPIYEFNVTDIIHESFVKRNIPINLGDIILTSTWSNPNRNGIDAVNPGTACEDIFYRTRSAIDGYGKSYQYMQIIVDHRGIDTNFVGIAFSVTIKIKNYLDATVGLTLIIINASTGIEYNIVNRAIYDSDDMPYSQGISFRSYSNSSEPPLNNLMVPWGMTLAIKCRYVSSNLIIKSDSDLVSMAFDGLDDLNLFPASVNPSVYEEAGTSDFYFWFKANLKTEATVNRLFKIILWKENFNPAEYTINYTVHPRNTALLNETPYSIQTPWTDVATFSFKYVDNDIFSAGITGAIVNTTIEQANGPQFNFGSGLTASWKYIYLLSGVGRYQIQINTTALEVREDPYIFNFNITKLGDDGLVHWTQQIITINLSVTPIQIQMDHWFIKGADIPTGTKNAVAEPFGFAAYINPENYQVLSIYLKVYTIISGQSVYVVDNSEIDIFVTLYDWNEQLGLMNDSYNRLTKIYFQYDVNEEYWVAQIQFEFTNSPDLVLAGYPVDVKLYGSTGIVINATSDNTNYRNASSKWVAGIEGGESYIPWWFWLMVMAVVGTGGSMGLYGIRKALQLRIPFVLRMIDESIDKIEKDKFPSVGVMMGRSEYVINLVIEYLDLCGIEWETSEKYEVESTKSEESEGEQPPMSLNELKAELEKMENLTPDERILFIDELKQLDRKAQIEFLKSLHEENKV